MQKSHKKVRVADFCRENLLDYYEMVEALKQEKFEAESFDVQVQCGDLVMQTDAQETRIQEKDSEVLRLLNQIATDMIRKSDVDRLILEILINTEDVEILDPRFGRLRSKRTIPQ